MDGNNLVNLAIQELNTKLDVMIEAHYYIISCRKTNGCLPGTVPGILSPVISVAEKSVRFTLSSSSLYSITHHVAKRATLATRQ